MKSDLIISKFITEPVIGTKSVGDNRTFFGSKMISIENKIIIDESHIQYSEVIDLIDKKNDGYQYYVDIDNIEQSVLVYLSDIKKNNHTIKLKTQSNIDKDVNTNWTFNINWKDILTEYLYCRLKEVRTFKSIKYSDTIKQSINIYIRDYIKNNILSKYDFSSLDLYIQYFDLDSGNKDTDVILSYNPIFDVDIKKENNRITNINTLKDSNVITVNYKQIQSSKLKTFRYYFDINIVRI